MNNPLNKALISGGEMTGMGFKYQLRFDVFCSKKSFFYLLKGGLIGEKREDNLYHVYIHIYRYTMTILVLVRRP